MSVNTAPQRPVCAEGETRNVAVSYDGVLDSGELLTGAVTVAEVTSTDLTFANNAVSSAVLTINDLAVAAGRAVQFKVTGQLAATLKYLVKLTVSTDATPAQTLVKWIQFRVAGA